MTNIELQKLFLDSPFDESDFTEEELTKIAETKKIKKDSKKNVKKLKINLSPNETISN